MRRFAALALFAALLCGCSAHPIRVYTPIELSGELKAQEGYAREEVLNNYPNAVLPHVKVVRLITWDEWSQVIPACLENQGWELTGSPDDVLAANLADDERGAYAVAIYVCGVEYPVDPRLSLPLNGDQQAYLYAYYVQVLKPCLELFGYVRPSPAPTLAEYLHSYQTGGAWNPYGAVITADWATMSRNCPAEPAGLYGSS